MATIAENITIIKNSIDRMKEALNLPSNTPLENLTLAVEDGGGSGGGSTTYTVSSIEERDSLTGVKEGDFCVVEGGSTLAPITDINGIQTLYFPDEIPYTPDMLSCTVSLPLEDGSNTLTCYCNPSTSTDMRFGFYLGSWSPTIMAYACTNGKTFTKMSNFVDVDEYTLSSPLTSNGSNIDSYPWVYDKIYQLTTTSAEMFVYVNGGWVSLSNPTNPENSLGLYKVATLEERDALSAKDGDICLVHNIEEFNCDGTKFGNTLVFPETIVSPTAITSSASFTFMYGENAQDYTRRLSVILAPTYFRVNDYRTNEQIAYYQSADGITYNRNTDYEEYIFENTLAKQYAGQTIPANLTPFLLMKNINMEGLFQFKTDTWEYLDIGVTGDASNVLLNIKSYTNQGTITGTRDMTKYRDDLIRIQDTEPEDKLGLWLRLKPDVTATYSQNTLAILPGSLNENPATQLPDITKIISTSNPYTTTYKYNGNWQYNGDGYLHGDLYYTHNNGKTYTSRCIKIGDYLYTFPTNGNTLTDNSNTLVEKINLNTLEVTSLANFPLANKYLFAVPIYDGNDIISLACPIYREADDDQYIVSYIYLYSISNNKWTTATVSSSNRVHYAGVELVKDGYAYIKYYDSSKTVLARYNLTTGAVSSTSISIPSSDGYYNCVDGGNGYLYGSSGYKYSKETFESTTLKTTSTANKIISYENSGNILTLWTLDTSYNLVRVTIDKDTDEVVYDTIKLDWTNKVAKDINHAFACEFNGDFILLGGCDKTDGTLSYKSYKISKDSIDYSKPFDMRKPIASSNKGTMLKLFTDYNKGKEVSITLNNKIYLTDVYYSSSNYENNYISEVYIGDGKTYTLFKTYE